MIKILLFSLMLLTGFVFNNTEINPNSASSNEIYISGKTESYSNTLVTTNDGFYNLSVVNSNVQPYSWVICGNPLLGNGTESYEYTNNDMVLQSYRTSASGVVYPINEEKYGVFAVDSEDDEIRLVPIYSLDQPQDLTGDKRVHLRFETVSQFTTSDIVRYDDSRKMKDLCDKLKISNDTTKVGYGKVMYRTGKVGEYYSTWKYIDLAGLIDSNLSLTFASGLAVQIVVIYEVREKATSIFVAHKYYHMIGIYQFMTGE